MPLRLGQTDLVVMPANNVGSALLSGKECTPATRRS